MPHPPVHALFIGINHYQCDAVPDLSGCVQDVTTMRTLLVTHFGGLAENMTTLTNAAATHAAIRAAFQQRLLAPLQAWAADGRPGEAPAILFYYSGHGSRARSVTKPSGFDETLVPHDSRTPGIYDIKDWELGAWLAELAPYTENVTVILDCCHSGSGTRSDKKVVTNIRGCFDDERPQPGPDGTLVRHTVKRGAIDLSQRPTQLGYVLLAACRNNEKAHEENLGNPPQRQGLLTYWLQQALRTMDPQQPLRYRELYDTVHHHVKQAYANQTPQCEGDRDRLFLGGIVAQPHPLPTASSTMRRVRLALAISEGWLLKALRERLLRTDIRPQIEIALPGEVAALQLIVEGDLLSLRDGGGQTTHAQYKLRDLNRYRRPFQADDFNPVVNDLIKALPQYQVATDMQEVASELDEEIADALEIELAALMASGKQPLETAPLAIDDEGHMLIPVGQPFVLSVRNGYAQPLYLTIIERGYDGIDGQLYPQIAGANEAVAVNQSIELGRIVDQAQQLRMRLPAGLPSAVETIQIIASTEETAVEQLLHRAQATTSTEATPRHLGSSQSGGGGYHYGSDQLPARRYGIRTVRIKVVSPVQ